MEGLVKPQPQIQPQVKFETIDSSKSIGSLTYDSVPIDIYRFFSLDLASVDAKDVSKLKEISSWALKGSDSIGEGLKKLRDLEIRLGMPRGKETRYDKIFNWVGYQNKINDLKQRQESLNAI